MDCNGKVIIEPTFDKYFDFSDGIGALVDNKGTLLVDIQGNKNFLLGIELLTSFSEGLAFAKKDEQLFLINKSGELESQLPPEADYEPGYFFALPFSEGLAAISTKQGNGYIDKTGKLVISPRFNHTTSFRDGIALVQVDGQDATIDKNGNYIVGPLKDQNKFLREPTDGLILMHIKENCHKFLNKDGETILEVGNYEYVHGFSEGLAEVGNTRDASGFIDKMGKLIIPIKFKYPTPFSEGLSAVVVDEKWGFIDKTGKFVIEPQFDEVYGTFRDGLAQVKKGDVFGYIDKNAMWVWKRKDLF